MKPERIISQSVAAAGSASSTTPYDFSRIKSMPGYNPKHLMDIQELASTVNPSQRRRRPRIRKRDPNRVPRPVNCFLAYRLEKQKLITTVCPGVNHREISKAVARWWSEEPEYEKEKYRQLAELDKQRHKEKYPNYKYCPKKKRSSNAKPSQVSSLVAAQLSAMLGTEDPLEAYLRSPMLNQSFEQAFGQTSESFHQSPDMLFQPSQILAEAPTPVDYSSFGCLQGPDDATFSSFGAPPGDSHVTQSGYNCNVADAFVNGAFWDTLEQPQQYALPSLSNTPSTIHMSPAYGSTNFKNDMPATVHLSDIQRPTAKDLLSLYGFDQKADEHRTGADTFPRFDSFPPLDQPVLQGTDFGTGTLIDPLYPPQTHFDNYPIPFV